MPALSRKRVGGMPRPADSESQRSRIGRTPNAKKSRNVVDTQFGVGDSSGSTQRASFVDPNWSKTWRWHRFVFQVHRARLRHFLPQRRDTRNWCRRCRGHPTGHAMREKGSRSNTVARLALPPDCARAAKCNQRRVQADRVVVVALGPRLDTRWSAPVALPTPHRREARRPPSAGCGLPRSIG